MAFELVTRQLGLFGLKKGYWVTDECTHWLEIICSNGTWGALHFTDTCACGRRLLLVFYCVISGASMLPVVRFISFFVSLPFQFEVHSLSFGKCIRGTNEIYGRKLFSYSKQIHRRMISNRATKQQDLLKKPFKPQRFIVPSWMRRSGCVG